MSPLQATLLPWVALAIAVGFDLVAPDELRTPAVYAVPLLLAARLTSPRTRAGLGAAILVAVAGGAFLGRGPLPAAALSIAALAVAGMLAAINRPEDTSDDLAFLRAILEALPVGVVVVEVPTARVLTGNGAFRHLLDPPSAEVPGAEASPPRGIERLLARAAERGDTIRDEEVTLRREDGRNAVFLASSTPLRGATGKVVAAVVTLVDVTEGRRVEEARTYLDHSTALLVSSLDLDSTLAHLTGLLVARLADWCVVQVRGDEWSPNRVVAAHRDAAADRALRDLTRRSPAPGRGRPLDLPAPPRAVERIDGRSGPALLGLADNLVGDDLAHQLRVAAALAVPLEASGEVIGTILLARSQSDYSADEQSLAAEIGRRAGQAVDNARRYDAVRRTGEMRRRFLTVASHELRTPVTGLLGYAQVELRRVKRHGALDPERVVTTLQAIERQARNLALLISRLLDVTMIDGGQVTLDQEEIDVAALVTKVVSRVRRQTSRHILLTDAPECLVGWLDPFWIEKVLLNLLDNAIRYSPEGGPIEVSLDPAEPGRMTLTVRDYGIGIPPDQLGRIFDRYVGAHEDSHRSGIGLGLSICRQIVEMHGGEIRAEAPETGGTRLRVTLPAHGPTRVSGGI